MSAEQQTVNEESLTPADKQILDELHRGARTKKAIVDATGLHRNTVGNRLDVLAAGEAIQCIHDTTALYQLVDDPRTDDGGRDDVGNLRESIEQLRADRDGLRDQLEAANERLADLEAGSERPSQSQTVDVAAIQRALDDIEAAAERGDAQTLQDALNRAREEVADVE